MLTKKGSVPHRPTFGSNLYKYIDYPTDEAIPNIIRETTDAIAEWETRITIKSVSSEVENSRIIVKIEWTLNDNGSSGYTEVIV